MKIIKDYNDNWRSKKIGLDVIKVINEPTASAIAYGHIIQSNKERNVWYY